jgi:hypothetical protein
VELQSSAFRYCVCRYVVKTGVNFGVDYCIYNALPSECHSEMCVTIVDAWQDSTLSTTTAVRARAPADRELSWRHVTTLTRAMPVSSTICHQQYNNIVRNCCGGCILGRDEAVRRLLRVALRLAYNCNVEVLKRGWRARRSLCRELRSEPS